MPTAATRTARSTKSSGCRSRGHFGAWRAAAALPSVTGGVLFMLVMTAGLRAGQAPVMLLWLSGAAVVCTRAGERLAVRAIGFHRPSKRQWEILGPICEAALARTGMPAERVDWYARAGGQPNACIAGRRSVAVTDGALQGFLAGRLSQEQIQAVLLHELGHLKTSASSFGLTAWWLAAPGRVAFRLVLGVSMALTGHRRLDWGTRLVAVVAGSIALVQAVQHSQWVAVVLLTGLATALIGTPVADAAISREAERAADRYTAALGAGADLASALVAMGGKPHATSTWRLRLLDGHPSTASRIEALTSGAEQHGDRRGTLHFVGAAQPGETVVVSGAAGAVGSLAGQLGRPRVRGSITPFAPLSAGGTRAVLAWDGLPSCACDSSTCSSLACSGGCACPRGRSRGSPRRSCCCGTSSSSCNGRLRPGPS